MNILSEASKQLLNHFKINLKIYPNDKDDYYSKSTNHDDEPFVS